MKRDFIFFLLAMAALVYLFMGSGVFATPTADGDALASATIEPAANDPIVMIIVPYRSPTPVISYSTATKRPTHTPFVNYTPRPSSTPRPTNTPTATPFPPQPFVVGPQGRKTSAPPERCPVPVAGEAPPPAFLMDYADRDATFQYPKLEDVLEYLNTHGFSPVRKAAERMAAQRLWRTYLLDGKFLMQDLTGDGVPEIMMTPFLSDLYWPFVIVGCQQGAYRLLYEQDDIDGYLSSFTPTIIRDGNRNGLPEILMITGYASQGGHDHDIIEWDGVGFRSLLPQDDQRYNDFFVNARGSVRLEDQDGDLVDEVVIESGIPVWSNYYGGLPWRNETTIYKWDGLQYRHQRMDMAPPEYRFQAVQDGDYYTNLGEYEQAAKLYQQAIFDPDLEWWSPERRAHLRELWQASWESDSQPDPTQPAPDPVEYGYLAAYARFRLMLLHLLRGWETEAQIVHAALQAQFPEGQPGYDFGAMSAAFWASYQENKDVSQACKAAQAYIQSHNLGLFYLGSEHHGWQSPAYEPKNMCPIK